MIVGIGIDVIEIRRLERELARGEWRDDDGVFTAGEVRRCRLERQPARRFAACFAAKEAALKALGIASADLGMLRQVELAERGASVHLHKRARAAAKRLGVRRISVSVAAAKELAGAMVVLEA